MVFHGPQAVSDTLNTVHNRTGKIVGWIDSERKNKNFRNTTQEINQSINHKFKNHVWRIDLLVLVSCARVRLWLATIDGWITHATIC